MKKWTRLLAVILSLALMLSLSACGSRSADKVVRELVGKDTSAIVLKDYENPVDYYRAVEERRAEEVKSLFSKTFHLDNLNSAGCIDNELKLSLDQSVLDSSVLNMLTQEIGVDVDWAKSLSVSSLFAHQDQLAQLGLSLRLNDTDIIHADLFLDQDAGTLYASVPELNDSIASITLDETADILSMDLGELPDLMKENTVTADDLRSIVEKAFGLVLDNVSSVKLSDGSITAEGISNDCTVAAITLDGNAIIGICKDALNYAKGNEKIEKIVYLVYRLDGGYESADEFHTEYVEELDQALSSLEDVSAEDVPVTVSMNVYIDGKGEILGRQLEVFSDGQRVFHASMLTARDKEDLGVEVELGTYSKHEYSYTYENETTLRIRGLGTFTNDGSLSGSFKVKFNNMSNRNGERDAFAIDIGTLRVDGNFGANGFVGDLRMLPSDELMDTICEELFWGEEDNPLEKLVRSLSLSFASRSTPDKMNLAVILCSDNKDLLTLGVSSAQIKDFRIQLPGDEADIVDFSTWRQSFGTVTSLNNIINNLRSAGVPATLINSITSY